MKGLILGKAIITKYVGSLIIATYKENQDTTLLCYYNYDHSMSGEENHLAAAKKLLATKWLYNHNLEIVAQGSDHDAYYFLAANRKILPIQAQPLGSLS